MNKINIQIWDSGHEKTEYAWIQIFNSSLLDIWEYINKLKINKNRIKNFYVKLHENGFTYNIEYSIKNYRRFFNDLIKRFKKLKVYCDITIIDMNEEKEYKINRSKEIYDDIYKEYSKNIGKKSLNKDEKRKAFNKEYIRMNEILIERTKERIKKEMEK